MKQINWDYKFTYSDFSPITCKKYYIYIYIFYYPHKNLRENDFADMKVDWILQGFLFYQPAHLYLSINSLRAFDHFSSLCEGELLAIWLNI